LILDIVPGKEPPTILELLQKKVENFKLLVSYVSYDCKKDWNNLFAESFLLVQTLWDLVLVDCWVRKGMCSVFVNACEPVIITFEPRFQLSNLTPWHRQGLCQSTPARVDYCGQ